MMILAERRTIERVVDAVRDLRKSGHKSFGLNLILREPQRFVCQVCGRQGEGVPGQKVHTGECRRLWQKHLNRLQRQRRATSDTRTSPRNTAPKEENHMPESKPLTPARAARVTRSRILQRLRKAKKALAEGKAIRNPEELLDQIERYILGMAQRQQAKPGGLGPDKKPTKKG